MLLVAEVAKKHQIPMTAEQEKLFGIEKLNVPRSTIPAATHVDYSARIQTVHRETNPRYHALISEFFKLTGCSFDRLRGLFRFPPRATVEQGYRALGERQEQ